jgi:hypothetical protein
MAKKNDAVKIAEIAFQAKQLEAAMQLITHPVVMYVAGFAVTEYLQRKGLMGDAAGTILEGGILAAPLAVKSIDSGLAAKSMDVIGTTVGDLLKFGTSALALK